MFTLEFDIGWLTFSSICWDACCSFCSFIMKLKQIAKLMCKKLSCVLYIWQSGLTQSDLWGPYGKDCKYAKHVNMQSSMSGACIIILFLDLHVKINQFLSSLIKSCLLKKKSNLVQSPHETTWPNKVVWLAGPPYVDLTSRNHEGL